MSKLANFLRNPSLMWTLAVDEAQPDRGVVDVLEANEIRSFA
ncbi:hypothetical protein [Rhizobium cauense]|nr:hypothetical protein [Rhizobium cauense]